MFHETVVRYTSSFNVTYDPSDAMLIQKIGRDMTQWYAKSLNSDEKLIVTWRDYSLSISLFNIFTSPAFPISATYVMSKLHTHTHFEICK